MQYQEQANGGAERQRSQTGCVLPQDAGGRVRTHRASQESIAAETVKMA